MKQKAWIVLLLCLMHQNFKTIRIKWSIQQELNSTQCKTQVRNTKDGTIIGHLTNYGQNTYFWTFWTFSHQVSFFRLQNMEGLTLVGLFMEGTTLTCLETYSDAQKRILFHMEAYSEMIPNLSRRAVKIWGSW
jgi:hypothetical protein